MSSISQLHPSPQINNPALSRWQLWLVAAVTPAILAPLWLLLPTATSESAPTLTGLLLTMLLVTATVTDLSRRKIYNWTTYTMFAWAILMNVAAWIGLPLVTIGLSNCFIGAFACFLIMLIPYSLARGGAGDVKLATAIGALVGLDAGLLVIAFAYIIAAVTIMGWACWVHGPWKSIGAMTRRLTVGWVPSVAAPNQQQTQLLQQPIPLAGFFLLATLAVELDLPGWLRSL